MSEEKHKQELASLDQAIETLADLLESQKDQPQSEHATVDYDEAAVPTLIDIVIPEEELEQELEPPVLTRDENLRFSPAVDEQRTEETAAPTEPVSAPPFATEELLRELEDIVDQELEKVTRSARTSILDSLKNRLDAHQDSNAETTTETGNSAQEHRKPVIRARAEPPIYLPMNNWKKDEDEDVSGLSLIKNKSDD